MGVSGDTPETTNVLPGYRGEDSGKNKLDRRGRHGRRQRRFTISSTGGIIEWNLDFAREVAQLGLKLTLFEPVLLKGGSHAGNVERKGNFHNRVLHLNR